MLAGNTISASFCAHWVTLTFDLAFR